MNILNKIILNNKWNNLWFNLRKRLIMLINKDIYIINNKGKLFWLVLFIDVCQMNFDILIIFDETDSVPILFIKPCLVDKSLLLVKQYIIII